jgi:hypothetical protein
MRALTITGAIFVIVFIAGMTLSDAYGWSFTQTYTTTTEETYTLPTNLNGAHRIRACASTSGNTLVQLLEGGVEKARAYANNSGIGCDSGTLQSGQLHQLHVDAHVTSGTAEANCWDVTPTTKGFYCPTPQHE